jgi:PEP-CTERM motif
MRVETKGRLPPCDRRLDRRKVATAAFAALFLFATAPARAAPVSVTFEVNRELSTISMSQAIDVSALFGHPAGTDVDTFVPQYPDPDGPGPITGSDTTYVGGHITGTFDAAGGGFIDLVGAVMPLLVNNTPGDDLGFPGAFNPEDLGAGTPPVGPYPGGITYDVNFGLKDSGVYGLALSSVVRDLAITWAEVTDTGPRPLGGGTDFTYAPGNDRFLGGAGRVAVYSDTPGLTTEGSLVGSVIAALGTGGVAKPSWDFLDHTAGPDGTLRLPIQSFFTSTFELVPGVPDSGTIFYSAVGEILATPYEAPSIPEPSSLVLLGFGLVGLLTCAWRLRKQRV